MEKNKYIITRKDKINKVLEFLKLIQRKLH